MPEPQHDPTPSPDVSETPPADFPKLQPTTPPEDITDRGLWYLGVSLGGILLLAQLIDLLAFPDWSVWLYRLVLLLEAALPLAVSFFLKDPKKATLLRGLGIVVLILYLITLF